MYHLDQRLLGNIVYFVWERLYYDNLHGPFLTWELTTTVCQTDKDDSQEALLLDSFPFLHFFQGDKSAF